MRGCIFRWVCAMAGLLLLALPSSGQADWRQPGLDIDIDIDKSAPASSSAVQIRPGYIQDWSSRHLLTPGTLPAGTRAEAAWAASKRDPRYVYNMVRRRSAIESENAD